MTAGTLGAALETPQNLDWYLLAPTAPRQVGVWFTLDGGCPPTLQERFEANISNFMDSVEAWKHYPCAKRAWVEYLGERPEPALDRVQ